MSDQGACPACSAVVSNGDFCDFCAACEALVERANHAATGWQCFHPGCREWATDYQGINALIEGKRQAAICFYCKKHLPA